MNQLSSYLPPIEGILPKWLLLVSIISVGNSVQAYTQPKYAEKVYTRGAPVNGLSSRTFGTWTLLSSVIRLYAAYNTSDPLIYHLAMWTYGIALFHFSSEWFIFKTMSFAPGSAAPMAVASGTFLWMFLQKDFYVK